MKGNNEMESKLKKQKAGMERSKLCCSLTAAGWLMDVAA